MTLSRRIPGLILLAAPAAFAQGDLDPLPGGPQPTMRTLEQVEPRIDLTRAPGVLVSTGDPDFYYVIQRPGSYFLPENRNAGGVAIGSTVKPSFLKVTADNVVVDLGGFQLGQASSGLPGATPAQTAIEVTGENVRVSNGSITDFQTAVTGAARVTVESLAVSECGSGIQLGDHGRVAGCTLETITGGNGIVVGDGGAVLDCQVANVRGSAAVSGIEAGSGSAVSRCVVRDVAANPGQLGYGITLGTGSSLAHCSVSGMSGANPAGIQVRGGSSVCGCGIDSIAASSGSAYGIRLIPNRGGLTVSGCGVMSVTTADGSGVALGFAMQDNAKLSDCSAESCATTGFSLTGIGSVATGCAATFCPTGFELVRSAAYDCGATDCRFAGFQLQGGCTIQRCFATYRDTATGGAGIWVSGSYNRVEDCTATYNFTNILVDGDDNVIEHNSSLGGVARGIVLLGSASGNHVLRNTSRGPNPFQYPAGNRIAPFSSSPASASNPLSNFDN